MATSSNATRSPRSRTSRASTASSRTSATRSTRRSTTTPACSAARVPHPAAQRRPRPRRSDQVLLPVHLRRRRDHGSALAALIDGNMDLVASSYDGRFAATNQLQHRGGARYEDMMSAEMDACLFFDVARIERRSSRTASPSPSAPPGPGRRWHQGRQPRSEDRADRTVPVPKNPHGVNASPDGKYMICSGKLSPTCIGHRSRLVRWFDGELTTSGNAVVAEVESASARCTPPSTAAATPSPRSSWTARSSSGTSTPRSSSTMATRPRKPVVDRIDVHYQPATSASIWAKPGVRRPVLAFGLQVLEGPLPAGRPDARRKTSS